MSEKKILEVELEIFFNFFFIKNYHIPCKNFNFFRKKSSQNLWLNGKFGLFMWFNKFDTHLKL